MHFHNKPKYCLDIFLLFFKNVKWDIQVKNKKFTEIMKNENSKDLCQQANQPSAA